MVDKMVSCGLSGMFSLKVPHEISMNPQALARRVSPCSKIILLRYSNGLADVPTFRDAAKTFLIFHKRPILCTMTQSQMLQVQTSSEHDYL